MLNKSNTTSTWVQVATGLLFLCGKSWNRRFLIGGSNQNHCTGLSVPSIGPLVMGTVDLETEKVVYSEKLKRVGLRTAYA